MSETPQVTARVDREPLVTWQEIVQQPLLWPTTITRVGVGSAKYDLAKKVLYGRVLLTGAGSSAYAAQSVALGWPHALAIPTTDLLVDAERYLPGVDAVISLARSGNSPESAAVVERVRKLRPDIFQLAITCNEENQLALSGIDALIVLDPRSNDRSLVMTGSFSNLVLAGLAAIQPEAAGQYAAMASERAPGLLSAIEEQCQDVAGQVRDRIVVLCSSPLLGWGREAGLKILEMTAARFPVLTETYLGLRHGPMSFLRSDTLVLCLLSSDPVRRLYELDLIDELKSKRLGRIVAICEPGEAPASVHQVIPAVLPQAPDELRTPFEVVIPQFIGYHLSLGVGLNPDNPSPDGVINRVVQGVRIHLG
jgi:tagatose-6-phosphate ketose/aldose isomerase